MKRYKIYTIGAMAGLDLCQQMKWRNELEECFSGEKYDKIVFIHPPLYYNYCRDHLQIDKFSEREVEEWEMEQLLSSDIAVVNLDDKLMGSIGSHCELGAIFANNMRTSHHIFTIGIGNPDKQHPWIQNSLFRCEGDIYHAAEYIKNYLLLS